MRTPSSRTARISELETRNDARYIFAGPRDRRSALPA